MVATPVDSLVASLVEAVTDYEDPREISDGGNQERAIQLLNRLQHEQRPVRRDAAASTTAVSNLVSAAASSSVNASLNSSSSIEVVLFQLSGKMLESTVEGEDRFPVQT